MENNPYGYNKRMPQHQPYNNSYPGAYINQPPGAPQALKIQQARSNKTQTPPPARMPKARALELVSFFKRGLVVISLATFASFSGLVAYHQISTTTNQKSSSSTNTSSSQQDDNTFFNQQGDDNLGTSTPTATSNQSNTTSTSNSGSSSGSNTGSSSGPVSGSRTS